MCTPVPVVTINRFPDPSSAEPSASIARLSTSHAATKAAVLEKSWWKAVWMTASQEEAPRFRLSRSEREPRWGVAPAARRVVEEEEERESART